MLGLKFVQFNPNFLELKIVSVVQRDERSSSQFYPPDGPVQVSCTHWRVSVFQYCDIQVYCSKLFDGQEVAVKVLSAGTVASKQTGVFQWGRCSTLLFPIILVIILTSQIFLSSLLNPCGGHSYSNLEPMPVVEKGHLILPRLITQRSM